MANKENVVDDFQKSCFGSVLVFLGLLFSLGWLTFGLLNA